MKITEGKSVVWAIFAFLTLIALGVRVSSSSSFVQPGERKTPEAAETQVAYPPPGDNNSANA